ncbi:DUF2092 domain-containing protein [uncultured Thiodictyon sp.]|uniref:DUF2092 domain-containing protein n=1 Tax=uncultured Thiodictyon sp. TaxID=1846217 RepID=UPI0025D045E3|nr:DUF2092 domain-containing protein [uncultured Thiodictyon sp.]
MRLNTTGRAALGCVALLSGPVLAGAPPAQAAPPDPNQIVAQMCAYLKSLEQFSYRAEVTDDQVYTGGKKLQFAFTTENFVQRPDKLRVNAVGDLFDKQFFFDGKSLTLFDAGDKVYATATVAGDIEGALEKADRQLRFRVPLGDLSSPKLCEHMGKGQSHALYVGPSKVGGVATDHLAFDRPDMQFQLWVATGKQPLPLKIVINQKTLPAAPQWSATLSDWKTNHKIKPGVFVFSPPAGVQKIAFAPPPAPAKPPAAPPAATPDTTPAATPEATGARP